MKEADPNYITVKITRPIQHETLNRRRSFVTKGRPGANVGNAAPPLTVNESRGDVNAVERNHPILWMKIGRGKAELLTPFGSACDSTFDTIGTTEHAAGEIHAALEQMFADTTRADATTAQTHFWNFICKESKVLTDRPQQIDVALPIVTKSKTAAQVNLFCVQTIDNYIAQEVLRADLRKLLIKMNYDGLFNAQHSERFDLLIESLQQRRRGFGMQDGARMRLEGNNGRRGTSRLRAFDHRLHDA